MKLSTRAISIVAAVTLAFGALGVTGCSAEEDGETSDIQQLNIEAQDISVIDYGYSSTDTGELNCAYIVENPNEGYVASGTIFTITAYDVNDMMIFTENTAIPVIYPQVQTAGTCLLQYGGDTSAIAKFEIIPLMDSITWGTTNVTQGELERLYNLTDIEDNKVDDGVEFTGNISMSTVADNGTATDTEESTYASILMPSASVTVLLKNAEGKIVGGSSDYAVLLNTVATPAPVPTQEEATEEGEENSEEATATTFATPSEYANGSFTLTVTGGVDYETFEFLTTPGV